MIRTIARLTLVSAATLGALHVTEFLIGGMAANILAIMIVVIGFALLDEGKASGDMKDD